MLALFVSMSLFAQEPPQELCVGYTGFASWLPPNNPNGLIGYRLSFEDIELGDIDTTEYQLDTDTLQTDIEYTFSVAAVYSDGISEAVSHSFYYYPCSSFPIPTDFKGIFVDENTVKLTWNTYYNDSWKNDNEKSNRYGGLVTHPGAGYNNGWDVSALHDGLSAYGFNVNRDEGIMVMDKFETPNGWSAGGVYGFRFYLFQDATPISTLTGVYMAIYDGDPLDGGQLIAGDLETNVKGITYMQHVYRTSENNFTEVNRPVACITASLNPGDIPAGTYWFIASFTGNLKGGVYAVPHTVLGQTTTGEARIYDPVNGWQPLLDPGTGTQQSLSFGIIGPGGGGATPAEYSDLYRDGELIAHGLTEEVFIDENVPHGVHNYTIVNTYSYYWECPNKSCPLTIDVRPCYPPKNFEVETEQLNDEWKVCHLTWDKEDDIPQREDIKTFYEIYRKSITDNHFRLSGVLTKDEGLESFEYFDTVPNGTYYYRINDYNVFPTGSVESEFVGRYGDCDAPFFPLTFDGETQWVGDTDGAMVTWGNLVEDDFHYDDGVLLDSVNGVDSQSQWGIKVPYGDCLDTYGAFLKSVSLFILDEGTYEIKVYEGYNEPSTLVRQMSVQLSGIDQWHTVTFDEPYQLRHYSIWVMVSPVNGEQVSVPYAGDDGTTDNGRWACYNGIWYKVGIDGSFMVRANYDNRVDVDYLMQIPEPDYGCLRYNLYRSTDNVNYELIAQIPYPNFECLVEYFDPHDDPTQECYYYQLNLSFRNEDETLCESTPISNDHNPLIDWAEVCNSWHIDEVAINDNCVLYPNPTTGLLTIQTEDFSSAMVYDLLGRLMKQSKQTTIDLGRLPQGLYVVKIFDHSGNSIIRKVIKQ